MSEITAGFVYFDNSTNPGGTQTAANSHTLIDNATIKNILPSELAERSVIIKSDPSDISELRDQDLSLDESTVRLVMKREIGNSTDIAYQDMSGKVLRAFFGSDDVIALGSIVEIAPLSGFGYRVRHTRSSNDHPTANALFVATATMDDDNSPRNVVASGIQSVLVTGDVFPGDVIVASDVTGYGQPVRNAPTGRGYDFGMYLGFAQFTNIGSGLVTCYLYG